MGRSLDLEDYGSTVLLIERSDWGAIPPNEEVHTKPLELPIMFIHFTHTDSFPCINNNDCKRRLQDLQATHMEEGASDIKFK